MKKTESPERSRRILIVEDDPTLLTALVDKFTREGFMVLGAKDGQEGLDTALREHPDLILLDVVMPVMDGLTVVNKLRHDNWGSEVSIILLTNLSDKEHSVVKSLSGSLDYIIKSDWKLEDIVKKVKERLGVKTP